MIQLTIVKITGYGPWTLTLGPDREHRLQMLQSTLYKEVQNLFSEKGCLAFPNRFDEIFVVSNGLHLQDYVEIQEKLSKLFELGFSITIGQGKTPFEANTSADVARRSGIILDEKHNILGKPLQEDKGLVQILHLDVDGSTSISKHKSPYEVSSLILKLYSEMSEFFLQNNCLTFFMGGDNFMVLSSGIDKDTISIFLDQVNQRHGISFNCGIGTAMTGRKAAELATKSLDKIRELRDSGKIDRRILEIAC